MSIVAIYVEDEAVVMACDGVATDPRTGRVSAFVSKLHLLPEISTMIGVTGAGGFGQMLLLRKAPWVNSFDDFVDDLPELAQGVHDEMLEVGMAIGGETLSSIVVAGWSESNKCHQAFRLVTYEKGSVDQDTGENKTLKPWVNHQITNLWASTAPSSFALERVGLQDEKPQSAVDYLTRMVCAGRLTGDQSDPRVKDVNIGGYVQLAMLQEGVMRSWVAHRWPEDVLGMPVDASRGAILPPYLQERDNEAS
ncbi:hypothetical protein [Pseudogemmobacter bohemicus]|uniref:hypothetical protein n=1 Tax=Pseudogemmobacter bohemicus TaxID=2250708 RepID=UPI000DD49960|nr:hypothetical protein [Pseudogemmobacter bohemicus]